MLTAGLAIWTNVFKTEQLIAHISILPCSRVESASPAWWVPLGLTTKVNKLVGASVQDQFSSLTAAAHLIPTLLASLSSSL